MGNLTKEQRVFELKVLAAEKKLTDAGFTGPFTAHVGANYDYMAGITLTLFSGPCPVIVVSQLPADAFQLMINISG